MTNRPHAVLCRSVDDDPVNQLVIQRMLTKAGFQVIKAATGDKALDLVHVGAAHLLNVYCGESGVLCRGVGGRQLRGLGCVCCCALGF